MSKFDLFASMLKSNNVDFNIKFKDESKFMKILGKLLFFVDFNQFTTTIGNNIYFTSKDYILNNENSAIIVLAHEYVHVKDSYRLSKYLFDFMYLFPQILFIPTILLSLFYPSLFIISFLFLLPWPAYFRMILERRGYTMSLYVFNYFLEKSNFSLDERKDRLYRYADTISDKYFKGFSYYKMWPFGVANYLKSKIDDILSNHLQIEQSTAIEEVRTALDKL